jgi:hypothetical protein
VVCYSLPRSLKMGRRSPPKSGFFCSLRMAVLIESVPLKTQKEEKAKNLELIKGWKRDQKNGTRKETA